MGRYKAVLMDLDQTLVDSRESILIAFEATFAEELGRELRRDELQETLGYPLRAQMAVLAGEDQADNLVAAYQRHLALLDHTIRVFPGWEATLAELRRRQYRLAVVTSKSRLFALRHLALHDLERRVDTVVTSDDTETHKPAPEPLLLAARRLGLPPAHCLVVGDSPWDMLAGLAAGMTVALAEWGEFDPEALARQGVSPHFRLRRPQEVLPLCPKLE